MPDVKANAAPEVIRDFHRALGSGDFERVSQLLDPRVVWRASPPSDDACANRGEVLRRLRQLEGRVPPLESLQIATVGDDVLVGVPTQEPWVQPDFYQRVRIEDDVITAIRDFASREAALAG